MKPETKKKQIKERLRKYYSPCSCFVRCGGIVPFLIDKYGEDMFWQAVDELVATGEVVVEPTPREAQRYYFVQPKTDDETSSSK